MVDSGVAEDGGGGVVVSRVRFKAAARLMGAASRPTEAGGGANPRGMPERKAVWERDEAGEGSRGDFTKLAWTGGRFSVKRAILDLDGLLLILIMKSTF